MTLKFDFSDFERVAKRLDAFADQIPFALAKSLNDAADIARRQIIDDTWPHHVSVRNSGFMNAALTTKGTRATKRKLSVVLYDRLGRAGLQLHAVGGTKRPRGRNLALPSAKVAARRTGKGVPKNLRPLALPNSFKQGDIIYQRVGKYQKAGKRSAAKDTRGLKLMYTLKPSVRIRPDVPFYQDFASTMRREVPKAFNKNIKLAMATAFRK